MEVSTFTSAPSHVVLRILLLIFLSTFTITSACDDNSNSTLAKTNYNSSEYTTNYTYSTTTQTFRTYIKDSCNSTTYPSICYQSLSKYASQIESDPIKLCNISLSLALSSARSASSTISKLLVNNDTNLSGSAEQVVQDCFGNVKDSIEQLQESLDAMSHLDDEFDRDFQISNIKTWVSSAITNDQTCYDGLDEMNVDPAVKDKIRKRVLNVARMTSNALYFINNNLLNEESYN